MIESGKVIRRDLTPEEIQILLDHPECVMFEPWKAMNPSFRFSLMRFVVVAAISLMLVIGAMLLLPESMQAFQPFVIAGALILFAALIVVSPLLTMARENREMKNAEDDHYRDQLKKLLPQKLKMKLFVVDWMVVEKAEGGYYDETGKEQWFGYVRTRNYFPINKGDELVIIYEEEYKKDQFYGFVKKTPETMSLYDPEQS